MPVWSSHFRFPVPVVQFRGPDPTHPPAALLYQSNRTQGEEADIRRCTHCSLGTWGKELNPGWRGWEGFLIYFSFF